MVKIRAYVENAEEESEEEMFEEDPVAVDCSYQDGVGFAKAAAAQKFNEVLEYVVNFSVEPVINENHRLYRVIAKEIDDHNVTIDDYNALLNEHDSLERKKNSEILKLQTKIQQLEAEKQTSSSLQGPELASSSSHSSEKEKTVVEADGQSKEESSAQRGVALEQLVSQPIPRIVSNVAAAKKAQLSINDQKPGSKEKGSISSAQEKRATSFHLELRSRSSAKQSTVTRRSQKIFRVARNTQRQSKAKQDAPVITKRSKRGATIKSSQTTEHYQLRKRRATATFIDASRPKRTRTSAATFIDASRPKRSRTSAK